jgi:isoleucyl-tRNA synthetase
MYASAPPYNPRRFAPSQIGEVVRQFLLTLWNTYGFFVTYANLDGWTMDHGPWTMDDGRRTVDDGPQATDHGSSSIVNGPSSIVYRPSPVVLQEIDRWALARLNSLVRDVTRMLDEYDLYGPAKAVEGFVDELSNWYVRRNRRRFWRSGDDADKRAAYSTLYTCLTTLSRLLAPFMPFVSEAMYRNLVAERDASAPESVHLAAWPEADEALIDEQLLADTALLLETVGLGRSARQGASLRVRQPLSELLVWTTRGAEGLRRFEPELREELNVKAVRFVEASEQLVEHRFKPNLPVVGRKYRQQVPLIRKGLLGLAGASAAATARAVQAGQQFELRVDGQMLRLDPEDVLVEVTSPEGYAVAEGTGLLVALNTTVTPELELEGQARDLVRFVQDARKAAGFDIADRVRVTVQPGAQSSGQLDLAPLLAAFGDYVRAETLADSLTVGAPEEGAYTAEAELGEATALIGVKRTGA